MYCGRISVLVVFFFGLPWLPFVFFSVRAFTLLLTMSGKCSHTCGSLQIHFIIKIGAHCFKWDIKKLFLLFSAHTHSTNTFANFLSPSLFFSSLYFFLLLSLSILLLSRSVPFASSCECVNDWRVCNHDNLNWNNCVLYIWCWFSEHHSVPHWRETCTIVFRFIELFHFFFFFSRSLTASFIFIWITLILLIVVLSSTFACTSFWWMYCICKSVISF